MFFLFTIVIYETKYRKPQIHNRLSFRMLEMRRILPYDVPSEVWKSEEEKEPLKLDFSIETCRNRQSDYIKSFKTMIYLEEAAQTLFLRTFNQTNVRIFYTGSGRLFFFLNEVSCMLCIER